MDHDDAYTTTKEHARSKYHHGRLPLFSNKTRGARSCMMMDTRNHESRVCDTKGVWCPSRTSQAAHEYGTAHPEVTDARHKSNSVSSDESSRSRSCSPSKEHGQRDAVTPPPRMHYEKPHQRHQSKKETLRVSKEMSHHRDRIQRREDLVHGL